MFISKIPNSPQLPCYLVNIICSKERGEATPTLYVLPFYYVLLKHRTCQVTLPCILCSLILGVPNLYGTY